MATKRGRSTQTTLFCDEGHVPQTIEFNPQNGYEILGAGTFNCVVEEIATGNVYRVGRITFGDDISYQTEINRSRDLVSLLNTYRHVVGPYFIQQPLVDKSVQFNELPSQMRRVLKKCQPLTAVDMTDDVNFQQIERLHDIRGFSAPVFEVVAFMLLWFLSSASVLFGFRHREIKPQNVMFRKLKQPQTRTFLVQPNTVFTFVTDIEPVIIDYDFASIFVTASEQRNELGTYELAAPERLFAEITQTVKPPGQTYDFFSLGMTLLYFASDKTYFDNVINRDGPYLFDFKNTLKNMWKLLTGDEVEREIRSLHNQLRILSLYGLIREDKIEQLRIVNPPFAKCVEIFQGAYKPEADMYGQQLKQSTVRLFESTRYRNTGEVILTLLSLVPQRRTWNGKPFDVLKSWFPRKTREGSEHIDYTMPNIPIFDDNFDIKTRTQLLLRMNDALRQFNHLKLHIECSVCQSPDVSYMCPRTAARYCSEHCYQLSLK